MEGSEILIPVLDDDEPGMRRRQRANSFENEADFSVDIGDESFHASQVIMGRPSEDDEAWSIQQSHHDYKFMLSHLSLTS